MANSFTELLQDRLGSPKNKVSGSVAGNVSHAGSADSNDTKASVESE